MKKQILHYWIDLLLFISAMIVTISGIIKFPGWMPALGISYLSLPMRLLTWLHDWGGLLVVFLTLLHTLLHWKWIVNMTRKVFSKGKSE